MNQSVKLITNKKAPVLWSFIHDNIGKLIIVGDMSNQQYPFQKVGEIIEFIKFLNEGMEFNIAHQKAFPAK